LQRELEKGRVELDQVERQRAYLRETMLRISGGIQVLEEVLQSELDAAPEEFERAKDYASRIQDDGLR